MEREPTPDAQFPPLLPHRGPTVLTFGILGVSLTLTGFCCCLCAVPLPLFFGMAAWVMGAQDLRAMEEGRMDPSGRGATQTGWILGIAAVGLSVLTVLATAAFLLLGGTLTEIQSQLPRWR
jgi:hypothetical protein